MTKRKVDLATAAGILGISKEAARKRIKRGSIEATKDEAGRLLVTLPDNVQDGRQDNGQDASSPLVQVVIEAYQSKERLYEQTIGYLTEHINSLERELKVRNEELAWKDTIYLKITQQVKQLQDGRQRPLWQRIFKRDRSIL